MMAAGLFQAVAEAATTLFREYKKSAVDLAKISAAQYYLKGLQQTRQAVVGAIWAVFGLLFLMNVFIVMEVLLLFYAPWSVPVRAAAALGAGTLFWAVPLAIALALTSEKQWMKYSKSDRLLARVLPEDGRFL